METPAGIATAEDPAGSVFSSEEAEALPAESEMYFRSGVIALKYFSALCRTLYLLCIFNTILPYEKKCSTTGTLLSLTS